MAALTAAIGLLTGDVVETDGLVELARLLGHQRPRVLVLRAVTETAGIDRGRLAENCRCHDDE